MLRNLCHRLDVRETFQRALPYHGKQQVALRLAFCPELRLGLFHLNDCPISLPSEMGLDLCGRLCHSCWVDPQHSSSVAAQAVAIPRRTLQRSHGIWRGEAAFPGRYRGTHFRAKWVPRGLASEFRKVRPPDRKKEGEALPTSTPSDRPDRWKLLVDRHDQLW